MSRYQNSLLSMTTSEDGVDKPPIDFDLLDMGADVALVLAGDAGEGPLESRIVARLGVLLDQTEAITLRDRLTAWLDNQPALPTTERTPAP